MRKNVVLLRVSTDMQDFNSQRNEIDEYVKKNNIIVHEIIEEPGVSGYKTKLEDRVGLQKLIKMASNNELDTIIVFNQDRIGRRIELITFMGLMNEHDVKVISVTEGLLNNKDDDTSELMQIMKFFMASVESKKTSYRVKAGKKAAMESNGYSGGVPNFGYRVFNKELVVDEYESDIVRFIFKNYIEEGTQKTIDKLNVDMLKRGEKWTKSKLFSVLKNTIYIGKKKYNDGFLDIPQCRIIDDELFNLAQNRAASRNQRGTVRYTNRTNILFEGLLFHKCEDGVERKLVIDYVKGNNGSRVHTYRCRHCGLMKVKVTKNFNSKNIEPIIISNIKDVMSNLSIEKLEKKYNEAIEESRKKINDSINLLTKDINKKNKAIINATKELENIFAGESNANMDIISGIINSLKLEVKEMEDKLNTYEVELQNLNDNTSNCMFLLDKYKDFDYIFDKANNEEKKLILQQLINRIVITEDEIRINLNIY